jgi:hypothetical protein
MWAVNAAARVIVSAAVLRFQWKPNGHRGAPLLLGVEGDFTAVVGHDRLDNRKP